MSLVNCVYGNKGQIGTDRVTPYAYLDGMKPCSDPLMISEWFFLVNASFFGPMIVQNTRMILINEWVGCF